MKFFTSLLILIVLLVSNAFAQTNVGEAAPNFNYNVLGGGTFQLSDQQGKVVYIFFFGANCPHCRDNGPVTESDIYQAYKDNDNFVAVGIDTWNTSASSVNSFKNITGISYPLLLQGQQSLVDYYGNTSSYDRSVVIAPNGNIAYKGSIFVNQDVNDVKNAIDQQLATLTSNEDDENSLPATVILEQNYPNPFNPETTISYTLERSSNVSIKVYDMLGSEVATLENGLKNSGEHTISFNASQLSSGIYFYRLITPDITLTKRMTLIK